MTEKKLEDMRFDELVDTLAGQALLELARGVGWRSIIFSVCQGVAHWSGEKHRREQKSG